MDILTPKGRKTREQEKEALTLFREIFRDFEIIETPKHLPADIDGLIVRDGTLIAGIEVKCRNMTIRELREDYSSRWLITADKIDRGVAVCKSLGIDFRGFLYLVPDHMLLIVPIWSYEKGYVADIEYENSKTQATVNGGTAFRLNAFVDVSGAKAIANI